MEIFCILNRYLEESVGNLSQKKHLEIFRKRNIILMGSDKSIFFDFPSFTSIRQDVFFRFRIKFESRNGKEKQKRSDESLRRFILQ